MEQCTFRLNVEPAVKQFLLYHYGPEPIKFLPQSMENTIIRQHIAKRPHDAVEDKEGVMVTVPYCSYKSPKVYNYMGTRGRSALRSCIEDNFKRCMWTELFKLLEKGVDRDGNRLSLLGAIERWCRSHGIDPNEHDLSIRQRFYRIRNAYASKGISMHKIERIRQNKS